MKPTIHKRKDIRGRIVSYVATIGPLAGTASSPAQAVEFVEHDVLAALDRLDKGASMGKLFDHLWIVVPSLYGFAYWIDTFSPERYSFNDAGPDREKAINSAIAHLAQCLWSADTDDCDLLSAVPKAVRGGLASWIGFQRSYIRIKAAGELTGENDIHNAACNMGHLYAREYFAAYLAR